MVKYTAIMNTQYVINLELNHLTLAFLVSSKFEMFASLQRDLFAVFTFRAFHTQYNFLGGLGLLPEDGLRLTTETLLFPVVTSSTLGSVTFLRLFVLCYLMEFVYLAFFAKGTTLFRYVHHLGCIMGGGKRTD